jgi:hypothetical protein
MAAMISAARSNIGYLGLLFGSGGVLLAGPVSP